MRSKVKTVDSPEVISRVNLNGLPIDGGGGSNELVPEVCTFLPIMTGGESAISTPSLAQIDARLGVDATALLNWI
ncbi:hypothetical protein D3C85_1735010 [compost metagenome]